MYKLCIFLVYDNDSEALNKTIESVTQAIAFEDVRFVIIFDRLLYELDTFVLQMIDTLPAQNVKCLYNVESDALAQQIIAEMPDTGFFFFIREGDTIDPDYLVYINYFFEDNNNQCDVLLTPVVKPDNKQLPKHFINLPYNGIKLLNTAAKEILPSSLEGIVLSSKLFQNIQLDTQDAMSIFYEVLLKAIIQKNSYGIINTIVYISDKEPQNYLNARLLKHLADYSLEIHEEIPCYLADLLDRCISEQFRGPIEDFNKDVFMLRAYAPYAFDEIERCSFSLCVTDIRNYFTDVEIVGTYNRPHWETETKLNVLPLNHTVITYEEKLGNIDQWKQEVHFKAIVKLEHNEASFQFGLHTMSGFEIVKEVSFAVQGEESIKINNYTVSHENGEFHIKKIAPRAYYKVSCIIPVFNGEEYLKEAVDSVISQSIDFFSNIQILLINNGSTDNTESICLEYANKYPYNICYFSLEQPSVSKARNHGLQYATGEYISFLDADDKLPPDYMEAGTKYLKSNEDKIDMVAFPIEYFGKNDHITKPSLNFRFTGKSVVDVHEKPNYIQFSVCSTLSKRSALDQLAFNENLSYSEDAEFAHQVILNTMQYGVLEKPAYLYRIREDGLSKTQLKKSNLNWYMKNTVLGKILIDYSLAKHDCVTQYTQNLIIHELSDNLTADIPNDIAEKVNIPSIMSAISETLQYVDDSVIKGSVTLDYWFKCFLLKLKYHGVVMKRQGSGLEFYFGETKFEPLNPSTYITAISEKNNHICVSGYYNLASYDGIELTALYNGQAYPAVITENRHKNIYFLGEAVHKANIFDIEIPFEDEGTVDFCLQVKGEGYHPITLIFPYTKDEKDVRPFFAGNNLLVLSTTKANQIRLERRTRERIGEMISNSLKPFSKPEFDADRSILAEYMSMYPIMSKSRIWLFMDEPKSANGNAEAMFSFCSKIKDGIDKIFVIDKNTLDGVRLEDIGTVIQYGSGMHKLMYLYAEKIIVSNVLDNSYNPFTGSALYSIYNSIAKAEVIYLPNEFQAEDMSDRLNRFTRNIGLFATVSETDKDFVLNNAYGYGSDVVQAIGLPKYDRLLNKEQKRIIFMPSWRESLYRGEAMINFAFARSNYCTKISELLCDERLLEVMMDNDYEMCFVPHKKTYLQLADFDMYENVNVISPDFSREELFTTGSLLITDWMPVFEFAYMKKPIIYYRFAEDETGPVPQYGVEFGETVPDNEALVDRIIDYIQNGCAMPERYVQQVDTYFKYTDNKNCERIYSIVKGSI